MGLAFVVSAADADESSADIAVQGEYVSEPWHDSAAGGHTFGLQLAANGGGRFRATLYPGGLPGNGWSGGERVELTGQREGADFRLQGGGYAISFGQDGAELTVPDASATVRMIKVLRRSRHSGLPPPPGSYVLFDGANAAAWKRAKVTDGQLEAGTELIPKFRDYQLHVEFLVPFMPDARGQGRGNSGIYLQSRYEVQVLDSFGLDAANNDCAALYRQRAPDLNMAFPPLSWQTYDITFRSPRFDVCRRKLANARLTLLHNGIAVHRDVEIESKTGAGQPEGPELLPVKLQDHGNPVYFRNIWLYELQ